MSSVGKLGELLIEKGVITNDQLRAAMDHRTKNRGRLAASLIQLGHINEKVLATFLSKQYGLTAISLDGVSVDAKVAKIVPRQICERHGLVPLSVASNRLNIAISDPTNVAAVDDVRFLCNMEINVFIATESSISALIDATYDGDAKTMIAQRPRPEKGKGEEAPAAGAEAPAVPVVAVPPGGEKGIINVIDQILQDAVKRKASDIHVEPFELETRVRFRIDGSLHEIMKIPNELRAAAPARLKVMSALDISEKRLPQDGRLQIKMEDRKVDVRVSVLPTIFGEKVVMRILDSGTKAPEIAKIGFEEQQLRLFQKAADQPYGMILVTGPTGSGKSTTLYALLNAVNGPDINISTVEDPVEYNMAGVNQVQMKESIGMNFAAALRSLLRQDPDILMVGEIRDQETAEIAIKAALTGHLVLSTLHTNDAPSTITRLLHMGIEPFLITAALSLVQAQRLIRNNCENCREPDPRVTPEMMLEAEVPPHWLGTFQPMRGKGCAQCGNTGYRGRRGIFEVMGMTERLRNMIIKGANADDLRKAAMEEGLITLRQHALLKLYRGETTLEEVLNNSRPDGDIK